MATEDYGSISKTTPSYNPFTEDGMSNLDLESKRRSLYDARSKLQHLENMNKVIGNSSDNREHRVAMQKNIEELLSDSIELVRDCVNLSLDSGMAQEFSQKRLMDKFIGEVYEFTMDFQRTSEMIARSQSDNPLLAQHIFISDDSVEQTPRDVTVPSLQMEAERRKLKERNKAFPALMQDLVDLSSVMRQMAVEVDIQQEGIECIGNDVEEAASNVSDGNRRLLKASVARDFSQRRLMNGFIREVKEFTMVLKGLKRTSERKRRRFISIIIGVVVGVVILVVLVSKW